MFYVERRDYLFMCFWQHEIRVVFHTHTHTKGKRPLKKKLF